MSLWSEQLLSIVVRIIVLAIAIFYVVFSFMLWQKAKYMNKTIINEMGRVLVVLSWINLIIALVMTAAFLLTQKGP